MTSLHSRVSDYDGVKVVVAMLARNEVSRYQPRLIKKHLEWADEVRVLDDASTDGTYAALSRLGHRVHVQGIMGFSGWDQNGEGWIRQRLLDWTMQTRPTHVVALDADEFIPNGVRLRRLIVQNPDADVFSLRMVEVWRRHETPWQIRVDGGWAPQFAPICWKVPTAAREAARPELPGGWEIRNVRMASGREPEIVAAMHGMGDSMLTGLDVVHLGWSDPAELRPRYERYMKIDGGRFHDNAHIQSIVERPTLEEYPAYPEIIQRPIL